MFQAEFDAIRIAESQGNAFKNMIDLVRKGTLESVFQHKRNYNAAEKLTLKQIFMVTHGKNTHGKNFIKINYKNLFWNYSGS